MYVSIVAVVPLQRRDHYEGESLCGVFCQIKMRYSCCLTKKPRDRTEMSCQRIRL